MKLTPFETYILFISLKQHFTTKKYDFFKYNGMVKGSEASFMHKKDRFQYAKLSKRYHKEVMRDFIVANIVAGKSWVGDFLVPDSEQIYNKFIGRREGFNYFFENDLRSLFGKVTEPHLAFKIVDGQYPPVIKSCVGNDIGVDTFSILNNILELTPKFNEGLGESDIIWGPLSLKVNKLHPFIPYNPGKAKDILKLCIRDSQTK